MWRSEASPAAASAGLAQHLHFNDPLNYVRQRCKTRPRARIAVLPGLP
jgi:hypothetical protein